MCRMTPASDAVGGLEELAGARFNWRGDSNYDPCVVGLHLCGQCQAPGDDFEQPFTVANIPARDHDQAKAMFEAARAVAECSEPESDFICDLCLGNPLSGTETVDDFYTNRQLWPLLHAAALRARAYLQEQSK